MEESKNILSLLDKLLQPVVCVKDNTVIQINAAARQLFLQPGQDIRPLLGQSAEEYEQYTGGCLYLSITVSGQAVPCCVQRVDGLDIFELDTGSDSTALRSLTLAAGELRKPLGTALTNAASLLEELEDPDAKAQLAQLNRGLYRILRILGNMSDAEDCTALPREETVNIPAVMAEIVERAAQMLAGAGMELHYEGIAEPVFALADRTNLERAVLNIISNAVKFSPKGSCIRVSLSRTGRTLRLSVQDSGSGIADAVIGSLFRRYLRQPGIEDSRFGLGLGIRMVHSIARQHGGTLLVSRGENGGTRTVMTLAIRQPEQTMMRSPVFPIDYSGGFDHGLVELADVLPAELYDGSY